MTYGYWIARARMHLSDTLDAMADSGPIGAADILSMTGSRAKVYQQVARHAELLIHPGSMSPRDLAASTSLATFRQRLRSVADDAIAPRPIASTSPPVRSLVAAADSLGVAGDILASVVFAGFLIAGFVPVMAIGLGLVLAVALDATIVRLLLVPATMTMLGRYNWWPDRRPQDIHKGQTGAEPAADLNDMPPDGDAESAPALR